MPGKSSQIILGIGGYTVDAGACLMIDGSIVGAIEEERFTRVKHQGGWPYHAIERLLADAGISESDVDHISFCYDPWLRVSNRIPFHLKHAWRDPVHAFKVISGEVKFDIHFLRILRGFRKMYKSRIHFVRHHVGHAASAFFNSPYDEAAFYTVDMRGEWDTSLLGSGNGTNLEVLGNTTWPDSLGMFYAGVTRHLGFGANDEYKVMGLSSYGEPRFADEMRRVIRPAADGKVAIDAAYFIHHFALGRKGNSYFTPKFFDLFGQPRGKEEDITQVHMDIARSAQLVLEECAFHQLNHLRRKVKSDNLCIAGGVAMNGVMNGRIYDNTEFKHVYVPPVAGDNGLSLGGACYVRHHVLGHPRGKPLERADWGTEWSTKDVIEMLAPLKFQYEVLEDVVQSTADLLQRGNIVGWFQGRMEFGARALGHRSILANPTLPDMQDTINACVKFREQFRPFAPAVVMESAAHYFDIRDPVPFMTSVCAVRPLGQEKLPATTHVDKTARVQTVDQQNSPLFWRLLKAFEERSGVPVLLNTSFNVMGEPIVETPQQAFKCFLETGLDALVIENVLIRKDWRDRATK